MSESTLVVLTVVEIVVLIAGLAFFLYWIGSLLAKIATTLEAGDGLVRQIVDDAEVIEPGLEHVNRSRRCRGGRAPTALRVRRADHPEGLAQPRAAEGRDAGHRKSSLPTSRRRRIRRAAPLTPEAEHHVGARCSDSQNGGGSSSATVVMRGSVSAGGSTR